MKGEHIYDIKYSCPPLLKGINLLLVLIKRYFGQGIYKGTLFHLFYFIIFLKFIFVVIL